MSSAVISQRHAAGQQLGRPTLHFEDLPVETMIEIISHLDFDGFYNMLQVNKQVKSVIESYWSSIIPGIIEQEFSPAEGFIHAFQTVVSPDKLSHGGFSFDLDHVLSRPQKQDFRRQLLSSYSPAPSTSKGVHPLLHFCRIIKRWEMEFPCLRFWNHPEYSRSLRPHELARLRQGLYVWWQFARRFHGGGSMDHAYPNPPPGAVSRSYSSSSSSSNYEARRAFMRQFSTAQLHEIYDVWETIRAAVGREVCPSTLAVREWSGDTLTRAEAVRIGWGDPIENDHILSTMMKLAPEDILHLLVYRHRYATKGSIVQFVRLRHPTYVVSFSPLRKSLLTKLPRIEDSIETFSVAILDMLHEREGELGSEDLHSCLSGFPWRCGGIIDHELAELEELRAVYNRDAGSGTSLLPDWFSRVPLGRLVASS